MKRAFTAQLQAWMQRHASVATSHSSSNNGGGGGGGKGGGNDGNTRRVASAKSAKWQLQLKEKSGEELMCLLGLRSPAVVDQMPKIWRVLLKVFNLKEEKKAAIAVRAGGCGMLVRGMLDVFFGTF
jgi:hypothetical protein